MEKRPRSLDVQRAQAEEMRQRLERQRYWLDVQKHDVEKAKIVVDVLKHFSAVIVAILFVLVYFSEQVMPAMQERSTLLFGLSAWDIGIVALAGSLVFALQAGRLCAGSGEAELEPYGKAVVIGDHVAAIDGIDIDGCHPRGRLMGASDVCMSPLTAWNWRYNPALEPVPGDLTWAD